MVLSDVSIRRPVFATVISLMLVVLGVASFFKLPIREYPAIDVPIVSISTVYRGAANDVVETRVTQLIESAVSGIEGIKRINSTSREERSNVTLEFRLGRDLADAALEDGEAAHDARRVRDLRECTAFGTGVHRISTRDGAPSTHAGAYRTS